MKKIILVAVILVASLASAQNVNLTVNTSGFRNNDGKVKVGLYNAEAKFLKETYLGITSEIQDLKATVQFKDLPAGEYAVSIYHDEDNDGKLKTGVFGIPKEDTACSNNAKGKMGPPKYADAKFTITKDTTIAVILNN
ncbi:DUF2141 domain-containing protein [Flavobacterium sp.]|uniref:DUF2141 domain-containing protein n=1 Tax=Flavobacterium sp. TaxID=239 RepID=UPI0037AC60B9